MPTAARPRGNKAAKIIEASLAAAAPRPDLTRLFDLCQKPGYYNAAAKAALLRRTKSAPHDELFVAFSRAQCPSNCGRTDTRCWTDRGRCEQPPVDRWSRRVLAGKLLGNGRRVRLPRNRVAARGGWRSNGRCYSRQDRFLLLADALVSPEKAQLYYAGSLPLTAHAAFRPATETREGWFEAKSCRRASVVPLAVPEWRAEFGHAELSAEGGRLSLNESSRPKLVRACGLTSIPAG
jgi:hypothetical protein